MNNIENRKALDTAVNILSYHMLSEQALFERLLQKGFQEQEAQAAVDKLCELKVLDDAAYAQGLADHCRAKGYGQGRLKRMLSEKKVRRDTAEQAFCDYLPDEDKAQRFVAQAFGQEKPDRAKIKKVSDKLFRFGYSWDQINRYIGEYTRSMEDEGCL